MMTSHVHLPAKAPATMRFSAALLLVAVTLCMLSPIARASKAVEKQTGSAASKSLLHVPIEKIPSSSAQGNAENDLAGIKTGSAASTDEKKTDQPSPTPLSDELTTTSTTLDHKVRIKRNWKSSRVQAAWGKRADDIDKVQELVSRGLRMSDKRLRRKWSQMGRQAWGKRDFKTESIDSLLDENEIESNNDENQMDSTDLEQVGNSDGDQVYVSDSFVPNKSRRKWGVGSAKAAWGKRKWGAINDMRVWGKRNADEDLIDVETGDVLDNVDVNVDQSESGGKLHDAGTRSKRSIGDGDIARTWLKSDRGLHRSAVDSVAAKRQRMSALSGSSVYGRGYIGPKRNWQTNTMKVWGKRAKNDDLSWLAAAAAIDELNDGQHREEMEEAPLVWNDVDSDNEEAGWKRAWSSDNSLRVWG